MFFFLWFKYRSFIISISIFFGIRFFEVVFKVNWDYMVGFKYVKIEDRKDEEEERKV